MGGCPTLTDWVADADTTAAEKATMNGIHNGVRLFLFHHLVTLATDDKSPCINLVATYLPMLLQILT
ncbi:MAG: hypothetical protein KC475_12630, partial [Cyanobacteria bacterium HKST-UBA03]|nr:hypothetical protein [Cyanobacteria bacterium HKST-UBA03]